MLKKQVKRNRRHKRVRSRVKGTAKVLRLCVFRSNRHIYAQLVDDERGKTLAQATDFEVKSVTISRDRSKWSQNKKKEKREEEKEIARTRKVEQSFEVGKLIAKKAIEKKIKKVVFDRGGYRYHGRVKALADGAREEGLKF